MPLPPDVTLEGLDWDEGNTQKCLKHGLTAEQGTDVFASAPTVFDDPAHSGAEVRYRAVGTTADGRRAFIAFTIRQRDGRTLARPISARYMHRQEIDTYETASSYAAQR